MIELVSPSDIQTDLPVPGYVIMTTLRSSPKSMSLKDLNRAEGLIKDNNFQVDIDVSSCFGQGFETNRDFTNAIKWYSKAAELGSIRALTSLGDLYLDVDKLRGEKDYVKAVEYYAKAAELGDARGQDELAICYRNGWGVEQNQNKAFEWFTKSANQGFTEAMFFLGTCYYGGFGVEKNYSESVRWMRQAAEKGFAKAQTELGSAYYLGRGVEQDFTKAVQWYTKAAEQGDASGQTQLGLCYHSGRGINKNPIRAAEWLLKAANQGFAKAQCNLGSLYFHGIGVEKNFNKAINWYRKAAEQGYVQAQTELGICYYNGNGIQKDQNKGIDLLYEAAKQGNSRAVQSLIKAAEVERPIESLTKLGLCYQNGYAVEVDYKKAIDLYKRAIELGDHSAERCLGECYFYGYGVKKDISTSKKWFIKAGALSEFEKLIEQEAKRQETTIKSESNTLQDNYSDSNAIASFDMFCKEFLSNRAECKTVSLFGKGKRFEILTTRLTFNIYNTFKSQSICTEEDGERLMDQYKNKNEINELIDILEEIYRDQSLTFKLPSIKESVAAQGAKVIDKKGVFFVVEFPEFEE